MNTMVSPSRVSGVSVYGDFSARWLPVSEALLFAESRPVALMLGGMRDGYLGREMVTVDDLRRWVDEDESGAQWADVTAGEQFAAENGLLR